MDKEEGLTRIAALVNGNTGALGILPLGFPLFAPASALLIGRDGRGRGF
jgi:hypothetical protein